MVQPHRSHHQSGYSWYQPDGGNEDKKYSLEYKGIIAFEDNWPRKGDYDLNDVIVKYQSVLNFNDANQALSTEDTYELLWSGATFKNGFAYQLNTERSNMSTEILEAPTTSTDKDWIQTFPKLPSMYF